MQTAMWEYIEVNSIGGILLGILLFHVSRRRDIQPDRERRWFAGMLVQNMLILFADNGICLLRGRSAPGYMILTHICCIVRFSLQGWFCYSWIRYAGFRLRQKEQQGGRAVFLLRLPALFVSAAALASPFTGWLYEISPENVYRRGRLALFAFGAEAVYCVGCFCMVLCEIIRQKMRRDKRAYFTMLLFPFPMIAGNVLQLFFSGLSIVWVCAALSMLILFVGILENALVRDELTGLFNHRQVMRQISWEVQHPARAPLAVMMLDVDHFKQINDNFGHLAGDRALRITAAALKDTCSGSDFIGRFGGDEFVIAGHVGDAPEAERFLAEIGKALAEAAGREKLEFSLTLSAGYVVCRTGQGCTADGVIRAADDSMYEMKRKKRAQADQA